MNVAFQDENGVPITRLATYSEQLAIEQISNAAAIWAYPNRPIRINLTDEQYVALLIDYPDFGVIRQELSIPVESNNMGGEYLYLEELYSDDRALFEYFGGGSQCIEYYQQ